ncbi:MAG: dihydrodipicolinate reductase C-terminal domain-containing protein [Bacteroidota bacterium]
MKIALLGYGKMGRIIDELATTKGHEIVLRVSAENADTYPDAELQAAEVAIEFSRPAAAMINYRRCLGLGIPVVSGTTGWLDQWEELEALVAEKQGAFFYASNFSLGVNLFFALNRYLAKLTKPFPEYAASIHEIHHTQKLDAPSGTAITLAEGIIANNAQYDNWRTVAPTPNSQLKLPQLPIYSSRIDPTPGTHEISWRSAIDDLEIKHVAHSREGFAKGALAAAEWLPGKQGMFGMNDLLNL